MNIEFLSTVALIAPDPRASRKLYVDALGLPLESQGGDYQPQRAARRLPVSRLWPIAQAAEACFGTPHWPAERPVPRVSIEFDVRDAEAVGPAARELVQAPPGQAVHAARRRGYQTGTPRCGVPSASRASRHDDRRGHAHRS